MTFPKNHSATNALKGFVFVSLVRLFGGIKIYEIKNVRDVRGSKDTLRKIQEIKNVRDVTDARGFVLKPRTSPMAIPGS